MLETSSISTWEGGESNNTTVLNLSETTIRKLGELLKNPNIPLHQRFRALFTLRNLNGDVSIEAIGNAFIDESVLLKHELAYCLGQMQNRQALPILIRVLEDSQEDVMVRHEAAEALGALGFEECLPILQKYLNDVNSVIRETCEIAVDRILFEQKERQTDSSEKDLKQSNGFQSIDPAPAIFEETTKKISLTDLKDRLMNHEKFSLFDRYKAMFTLRNIQTDEACLILTEGFQDSSALFRHEIAFVLGQLQNPVSVPALIRVLSDKNEHEMVRHECAEALGSIASDECLPILNEFKHDNERVVRESCIVALDMYDYETSNSFQYTDSLQDLLSH